MGEQSRDAFSELRELPDCFTKHLDEWPGTFEWRIDARGMTYYCRCGLEYEIIPKGKFEQATKAV